MASGVWVTGLRETVRTLERYGVEASDLKAAFQKIGMMVKDQAVTYTPTLTGRLAGSIRASKTKNKAVVRAGNNSSVIYAAVQHWGGYNGIAGSFYLTKAVAEKQDEAVDLMESELEKLAGRLGLTN